MSGWGGRSQEGVCFSSSTGFPEAMTGRAIAAIMVTSLPHQGLFLQPSCETSVLLVRSIKRVGLLVGWRTQHVGLTHTVVSVGRHFYLQILTQLFFSSSICMTLKRTCWYILEAEDNLILPKDKGLKAFHPFLSNTGLSRFLWTERRG